MRMSHSLSQSPLAPLLLAAIVLLLVSCSSKEETGPVDIRWDRESCARCAMSISDHNYAAEIRGGPAGKKTSVYKFDDIGCAVLWLEDKPWKNDPRTEIWVTDYHNGNWLDARKASYVQGQVTPMGYGLGAQSGHTEGALDFAAAERHIHEVEETTHKHRGGHMHNMSGEQK